MAKYGHQQHLLQYVWLIGLSPRVVGLDSNPCMNGMQYERFLMTRLVWWCYLHNIYVHVFNEHYCMISLNPTEKKCEEGNLKIYRYKNKNWPKCEMWNDMEK